MIVKMMKYSFLIFHKEYAQFLEDIRQLGAVHVIEKRSGVPEENSHLQEMLAAEDRLKKVIAQLTVWADEKKEKATVADSESLLNQYDAIVEGINREKQRQAHLLKEIERTSVWGDFKQSNIARLAEAGYLMGFYSCSQSSYDAKWETLYNAITIATEGSTRYFITLTPSKLAVEIESAEQVRLPEESLSELRGALDQSMAQEAALEASRKAFATAHLLTLEAAARTLRENFEYSLVELNTEKQADDKLMLLEGWVPVTQTEALNQYLDGESIYYQSEAPTEEENAPILLKNNKFARLFEVIGELYDMPNYHEMDLTPFFAPFFVMFFGLCLGDAGYGLLLTAGAFIARSRMSADMKPFMTLAGILGIGTVIFGTLSGTLFGINLIEAPWPWLAGLKKFMMNSDNLFNFALGVGVAQIVFGMVLRAVGATQRFGFLKSLSHWGWLLLIVGGGATYALQMTGVITPEVGKLALYGVGGVSALGIFLFNDIKRNPLINVGAGLWDTYNMATGLMGDLLSYIRLFALGISGSVMGLVFNDLAVSLTAEMPIVIAQIVMVLILLMGHGMNIFMNGLGAFVHPMRLTFVEFYKNAGFEGGGKKYAPFARKENNN